MPSYYVSKIHRNFECMGKSLMQKYLDMLQSRTNGRDTM